MNLYLDIETIGTEDEAAIADIAAGISPPGNISKAETIAAWVAEKKPAVLDEAVRKTAFDGGLGKVICFGYALGDGEPQTITGSEPQILTGILDVYPQSNAKPLPVVVGHNVQWDVRFLWQRFVVNGISPPRWLRDALRAKPWEIADTMLMWNPERERRTSLDKLCRILGVPSSKGDLDGSKVWDAYRAGELQRIAEYCAADVVAMRECYLRMVA